MRLLLILFLGLAIGFLGFNRSSCESIPLQNQPKVEFKPYTETIPGTGVQFDMVPIPGGSFSMGSPDGESNREENEGPQRKITLKPFWMGKCEVTWNEYDLFAFSLDLKKELEDTKPKEPVSGDAVTRPTPPYTDMTFGYGHDGYPAICMTHHAAMEYCYWLSKKTGKTYRLPTEAEWEYACRANTKSSYSYGDDPEMLKEYAWYTDNADAQPHPVGKKKPNPWGLHDMHGNVAEWCIDHFDPQMYSKWPSDKALLNPFNKPTNKRFSHIVRGGSWDDEAGRLRSAARRGSIREWLRQDPQRPQSIWWLTEALYVGFRVVRPVEEYEELKNLRSTVTKTSPYQ